MSRTGQEVASIVTLRPGAPDMASSLWVGPLGGNAAQAMEGRNLSRPSWSLDDAIWVVVDGNNVVRAIQDASGHPVASLSTPSPCRPGFPG